MVGADAMRASDRDRQAVVDRLRTAVGDGRLQLEEYLERMGVAYEAVTLGDLAPLCADLPASGPVAAQNLAQLRAPVPATAAGIARSAARLPLVLRVAWAIWLTAVLVNVVVWVLVSVTSRQFMYPWPLWVAGPYGAVLVAISAAVSAGRSVRR